MSSTPDKPTDPAPRTGPFAGTLCNADRILVVMRHAKSSWSTGAEDHERPLSNRGHRDGAAAGAWLVARGIVPDLAIVSTATRTRETLARVWAGGVEMGEAVFLREVYDRDRHGLLELVRDIPDSARTVLLIGHNPALEGLVRMLARRVGHHDWWGAMDIKFPTSALAVIGFDGNWTDVEPGVGALLAYEVPRGVAPH